MRYRITKTDKLLKGVVQLPGSKSITNRALIIKALCDDDFSLTNFSQCEDSLTLVRLINSSDPVLDARDGGTTFRFLTAFLAIHEGEVLLTGSERLQQRPIGPLVDALIQLGADIQYQGRLGYPPILIRGKMLTGNKVEIDASTSSQFISALLLIAPKLRNGLILKLKGDMVSKPYVELTLQVMKHFGISYEWTQSVISIPHQSYMARDFRVESDWSAASYFYAMTALSDEADVKIYGLNKNSIQGDAIVARIMEKFGVQTTYIDNGIRLTKHGIAPPYFEYDFRHSPDLAQTFLFTCAALGIPAAVSGLNTLRIKETDRVQAVKNELARLGVPVKETGNVLHLGINLNLQLLHDLEFETYNDHRMAMALAPLAMVYRSIYIDNPLVVSKSYPHFWDDIQQLGFQVESVL